MKWNVGQSINDMELNEVEWIWNLMKWNVGQSINDMELNEVECGAKYK